MTANKQKHKQAGNIDPNQALNNFMLLINSLKKSTAVLVQALLIQNLMELLLIYTSKAFLLTVTSSLNKKISRMKSCLIKV